jgi:Domain of unknown function (DUF4440)/Domain of unknown function (DUF3471)
MRALLNVILLFAVSVGISATSTGAADDAKITEKELVSRTQALFDAVVPGDPTPWKKSYAEDCLFHDEKGRSLDKAKLMTDISPMPKGYSGTIKVVNPQSIITAECAILSYDCDESETVFGQELHARYHQTDTWLHRKDEWQIAASQTMRYYEDPALGKADPAQFSAYAGLYELSKDSERRTTISFAGEQLFMERTGGQKTELFPESGDLFFRKGMEGRILFHFGGDGKIDSLLDRRNNEDVVWKKIG